MPALSFHQSCKEQPHRKTELAKDGKKVYNTPQDMNIFTPLAQFGTGFEPVASGLTENSNTNEGAISDMERIISNGIGILTVIGGIFFLVYFLLAVYQILTAGGDSGKLTKAWQQIVYGALGLILLVAGFAVIGLIGSVVGIDILNPGKIILEQIAPL